MSPTRYQPSYLLEIRLGGDEPLCYAREELRLTSREDGGERVYTAGLDVVFTLGGESISVTVRRPRIAELRNRVGPLVGRPFALRFYRGEGVLEDALIVLQGVVSSASWAAPGSPDDVALTLRRAERELASDCIDPQAVLDNTTIPDEHFSAGTEFDPNLRGQPFPLIFGAPGRQLNDSDTASARAATPALLVEDSGATGTVLLAGHEVEAAEVDLWQLNASAPVASTFSVTHTTDALGRTIAICAMAALVSGPGITPAVGDKLYAGWSPRAGKGRGMMFEGEPVRGVGDLTLWGARNRSSAVFDLGRMRAERQTLNRYEIDAVINQRGLRWSDWLARNVLEPFDIALVSGPRGFYYQERVYAPDPARVRATLVTDRTDAGILVRRDGAIQDESLDEVANEITLAFSPYACSTSAYSRRVTIGPNRDEYFFGPGSDSLRTSSRACRRSEELFGPISRTFLCGVTADTLTAQLLVKKLADKHAMPAQLATYTGGPELMDLEAYDTVEIVDTVDGAALDTVYGLVQPGITVGEREVTLTVRIPEQA